MLVETIFSLTVPGVDRQCCPFTVDFFKNAVMSCFVIAQIQRAHEIRYTACAQKYGVLCATFETNFWKLCIFQKKWF